jgi:hypothetical protein
MLMQLVRLCSAIVTMGLAIVKDIAPSLHFVDHLKNACGIVSVPAEGLIAVLYWGLKAYDPSLLVPPDPKYQIPLALDLSLCACVRRMGQPIGLLTFFLGMPSRQFSSGSISFSSLHPFLKSPIPFCYQVCHVEAFHGRPAG